MYRIGIDLGGSKIEGAVLDSSLEVLERRRVPTCQERGYQYIIGRVAGLVGELARKLDGPYSVGICTPGSLSPQTGRLRNSNTLCLNDRPLQEDLEAALGSPLVLENDANCFALAEARLGAAGGQSVVFGVILGTGVGGGIILDGKIHRGRLKIAGEWGHHTLHPEGNPCYCGRRGCVETYLCGPALERRWQDLTGWEQRLPEIAALCEKRPVEPLLNAWKDEFLRNFGLALSNVINILDPDLVVLGGGVSNLPFLYAEGREEVYRNTFSDWKDTPILKHELGDSAGVIGAALLP